jgi:hypothetical protein
MEPAANSSCDQHSVERPATIKVARLGNQYGGGAKDEFAAATE